MDNDDFKNRLESIQGATLNSIDTSKLNSAFLHMRQENIRVDKNFNEIMNANAKRSHAIIETAENTKQIHEKVASIENTVMSERKSRERADEKNHNEAVKWHKIDFAVAILGVAAGIAGVLIAIFH